MSAVVYQLPGGTHLVIGARGQREVPLLVPQGVSVGTFAGTLRELADTLERVAAELAAPLRVTVHVTAPWGLEGALLELFEADRGVRTHAPRRTVLGGLRPRGVA